MPSMENTILNGLLVEIDYTTTYGEIEINAIYFPIKGRNQKKHMISDAMEKWITEEERNRLYEDIHFNEIESRYHYER